MECSIQNDVFISVLPATMNRCVFVRLERALRIYIGSGSSSTESTMLGCHVSTVAHNGQTKTLAQDAAFRICMAFDGIN